MTTIPRRTVRSSRPVGAAVDEFEQRAQAWYANWQLAKQIKEQQSNDEGGGYRGYLLDHIKKTGRVINGAKGSRAIWFSRPIGDLYGLEARNAPSPGFSDMVAAGLLKQKGPDVEAACTATDWSFRPDKLSLIVQTLDDAGILDECVADGYPKRRIDQDLMLRYHAQHPGELTAAELDLAMPDEDHWSLQRITEPYRELPDAD